MADTKKQTYKGYLTQHFIAPACGTLTLAVGCAIGKYSTTHDFVQAAGVGLGIAVAATALTLGMSYALYKRSHKPN